MNKSNHSYQFGANRPEVGQKRPLGIGPLRLPHVDDPLRRQGMEFSVWEGSLCVILMTLTGGKFLIGYLFLLGATPLVIGLVNAVPFIFQFFQLFSAYLTQWVGSRKVVVIAVTLPGRLIWVLAAFLPFFNLTPEMKLTAFLAIFAFYNIMQTIAANAWLVWMNDLIPVEVRGRYIAIRGALLLLIITAADWLGSQVLDYFTAIDRQTTGFLILFAFSGSIAFVTTWLFKNQYEPPMKRESIMPLGKVFRKIRAHAAFLNVIRFFFIWNLGLGVSSAFFHPHMLSNLGMNYSDIWTYSMIVGMTGFFSSFVWGKVQDHSGTKPIMMLTGVFICLLPLIWLIAKPDCIWPLYIEGVCSGILWVGFNTAGFNLPLITAPDKARSYFLAVFASIAGLSFAMASFGGGIIAESLSNMKVELLGQTFVNFHVLFIISSILRFTALGFLLGVKGVEVSKGSPRAFLMNEVGLGIQKARYFGKQYLMGSSRWLRRNGNGN